MYSALPARVHVNNYLSQQISLPKGTRQGCLLSLILFNMALELLLRHLMDNLGLHGIKIGQIEVKKCLLMTFYFLLKSGLNVPEVQKNIQTFGRFSGLKISFSKRNLASD